MYLYCDHVFLIYDLTDINLITITYCRSYYLQYLDNYYYGV
jgi:hypothetical protein